MDMGLVDALDPCSEPASLELLPTPGVCGRRVCGRWASIAWLALLLRRSGEAGEAKSVSMVWTVAVEALLEDEKKPGSLPTNGEAGMVEP